MKRPSLSFDKETVLAFLFNHCEKFVAAIVALAAVWLALGGIGSLQGKSVKPEQTPASLSTLNAEANRHIDAVKKPPASSRKTGGLAPAIDPWRPQQVKVAAAPEMALLDRPLFQELAKRTKPDVFPIEDLRAVAGIAVLSADEAANATDIPAPGEQTQVRGRITPYVIVTGLLPTAKQQGEFERCFAAASFRDRELDTPRWGLYRVERAVVGANGPERWDGLKVKNVETFERGGLPQNQAPQAQQQDIVPRTFLVGANEAEMGYAAGVPPRIDDSWGFTTIHPWFIPQLKRIIEQTRPAEEADKNAKGAAETVEAKRLEESPDTLLDQVVTLEDMVFVGDPDPQPQVGVDGHAVKSPAGGVSFESGEVGVTDRTVFAIATPWAKTLALEGGVRSDTPCTLRIRLERIGPTPVARIIGIQYGGDTEEILDPQPMPLAGRAPEQGVVPRGPATDDVPEGAEFRLFRFVDTDVKPGVRYSYRVKFALRNPNFGLDQQHLTDPALAKGEFLLSKESNQSSPVRVPEPTSMLVKPLAKDEIKRMKMKPGAVEILVLGESAATGNFAIRSLFTEVGGLANVDPSLNKPGDQRTRGEAISTGRILVDMRGRQEDRGTASAFTGPGDLLEMLFLDPNTGTFEFVSAADSQSRFDRYSHTLPMDDDPKRSGNQPSGPSTANPYADPAAAPGRGPR